jgi:hypothetical protein
VHEQCHQRSVQGGVYLLYLQAFAFKYRYIHYMQKWLAHGHTPGVLNTLVDAVACDPQSISPADTVAFGVLVHNWLGKVRPPGPVSCVIKQPCQD